MNYWEIFIGTIRGTTNWVWQLITFEVPWFQNYFYGLIAISLFVYGLELIFPWRKNQSRIRKDFWLDGFYMFFNFFVFSIAVSGFYALIEKASGDIFGIKMSSLALIHLGGLPSWLALLIFFILSDFVQWCTHVMLHHFPVLWQFHKVHHSVKEMGFAAHLRYHWMENILYKPLKTLVVMVVGGFEPEQAFMVHFLAILIGHMNHANFYATYGPLKYIFNNPVMHLWHHSMVLPKGAKGVNFGISLSLWDYLFRTNHIPNEDGEIELGFPDDKDFPTDFWNQIRYGFGRKN